MKKHTPLKLEEFLKGILNSRKVNLFLLYELKESLALPDKFEISINEIQRYRNSPIKKTQGFLNFPNEKVKSIVEDLVNIANEFIDSSQYSISGLANYLILVDRLGSLTDSDQYDIIRNFCEKIPKESYLKLLNELIITFNAEYSFSNNQLKSELSFKEWEDLFLKIQYIERNDNPIGLLRWVLKFRIREIPILELIMKIKPDVRAALFEYGIDLNNLSGQEILDYLKTTTSEITFFSAFIANETSVSPTFIDENLVTYIIKDNWNIAGKYLARKVFDNKRKQLNESTRNFLLKQIDLFLRNQFTNDNVTNTIIKDFSWTEDYSALGGWLVNIHDSQQEINISFNKAFLNDLVTSYSKQLCSIKSNIPVYIYDSQKSYNIWFSDVFDLKAQYVTGYIMWSFLNVDDNLSSKFITEFKHLCYEIKELYYGSFQANHLAQKLSNYLLCFILSYPTIDNVGILNIGRLEKLINIFKETIGIQWIIYTERNQLIWKNKPNEATYSDTELLYILKRLENIPSSYKDLIEKFRQSINKEATINWPVEAKE